MKDDAVGGSDRLSLFVLAYLGETYQTASRGEDQEEDGKDETG